jgi:hypothetical protein
MAQEEVLEPAFSDDAVDLPDVAVHDQPGDPRTSETTQPYSTVPTGNAGAALAPVWK